MSGLPDAVPQTPACGACGRDTDEVDCDWYTCYDCKLTYDTMTLTASFHDEDDEVCGNPCDNTWHHRPGAIWPDKGFRCHPCQLPAGHYAGMHWTGCEVVAIAEVEAP